MLGWKEMQGGTAVIFITATSPMLPQSFTVSRAGAAERAPVRSDAM